MTIDHQASAFWKRIPAPSRAAFFSCFVTGCLVHLYAFTNLIPNSDGLSRVYDTQQMTVSGRWFLHYVSALNGFTQMPMAIGILALVFLGLTAGLLAPLLGLESRVLAGAAGALLAAFPSLGYTFLYMFTASDYCAAIFLAVLGVWLTARWRFGWIAGACALALSMGIYQAYASVAVGLSLLVVFRAFLDPEKEWKPTLWLGLRLVFHLAAGAVLYYVTLMVFLKVKNLELLSYLGIDAASSGYPIGQLPHQVLLTYMDTLNFFFSPGSFGGFANGWMAALDAALLILAPLCLVLRLGAEGMYKQLWRIAGALIMVLLLPVGIGFGRILSPYADPTPMMKYAFVLVYLAALMLVQMLDGPMQFKALPRRLPGAMLAWTALFLLFCLNTNNLIYTASAQAHRATESTATRLLARIEACEGYEPGMEIAIIGPASRAQGSSDIESYRQVQHYSVPSGSVLTLNKHVYYYFQDWLNMPIEEPAEQVLQAVSDSPEFQAMPLYPAPGSVKVLDGRVVVRMAEEYTPKAAYEVAYENRR